MTLAVGTLVVYGSYGIGTVTHRRTRGTGAALEEMVVIEFAKSLAVTLPLARAVECLRPLSGATQVAAVQSVLRSHDVPDDESWQRRTKLTKSKIVTGDAVALAEVVRNSARREGSATASGGVVKLSTFERQLYLEARQLLAAELAISQGIDEAAADEWIEAQLGHALSLTQ